MKILLVSTPWEKNPLVVDVCDDDSHYPLGLAYLHSYLESKGHWVTTLWLNNHPEKFIETICNAIEHQDSDLISFSTFAMNRASTYVAIEYVHKRYPTVKIVLGGLHATIMYRQLLQKYPYITVVRGEGEETLAEIAAGKANHEIKGIAYNMQEIVLRNVDRPLMDLDTIPFPKHELFFKGKRTLACIMTSRGCNAACTFCCLNPVSKQKVRFRSVSNVMSEMQYLIESFPNLKTIFIHDDSFFLNNRRVIEICDEIIRRGIKMQFICSGRAKPISLEMIFKLEQAGFTLVLIGLESGDKDVLEKCNKNITREDVCIAVEKFAQTKVDLGLFLIAGLPGESSTSIQNTTLFIQRLQKIKYLYFENIGMLMVYPGTAIYEQMKAAGKIDDDYWLTDNPTSFYTVDHTPEKIMELKSTLLDGIAAQRIITWEGFKRQWYMLPWSVPYMVMDKLIPKIRRSLKI